MSTQVRDRIREVFVAVCEHPPADQLRILAELCGNDDFIKTEVQSLLGFHHNDTFLSASAMSDAGFTDNADSQISMPPGTKIGRCSITRLIGAGGMGVVYEARQDSPDRQVALKIMRPGGTSSAMVKRFAQEARALAILQHPGIAQIYDAGRELTAAGPVPYLVMELVEGITLNTFINRHKLALPAKLKLILQICDAVAHAHLRGVIHRDLKPTNILVDDSGRARILDFGIARLAENDARATISTSGGQVLGTLAYMSPEQSSGDPAKIDTRADVYSLGVVLYEVLTGKLPIDVTQVSIAEAVRRIRDTDPTPPSAHSSECRGELDTIALKALSKDSARRYQSAQALAEDIRRYLTGHPILARGDSALYVLSKHVRRHRVSVAAASILFVGLIVFSIYASIKSAQERSARNRAEYALALAKEQTKRADESSLQLERELHFRNVESARLLARSGNLVAAEDILWLENAAWPKSANVQWGLRELYHRFQCLRTIPGPVDARSLTMHANGRWIAHVSGPAIRLVDSVNGEDVSSTPIGPAKTTWMDFSKDGKFLVRLDEESRLSVFRVGARGILVPAWNQLVTTGDPFGFHIDSAAASVAIGCVNGRVTILSLETGEQLFEALVPIASDAKLRLIRYSADNKQLLAATQFTLYVVDISSEAKARRIAVQTGTIVCIVPTPDGTSVFTGSSDTRIRCYNLATGALITTILPSNGTIRGMEISPDGRTLATTGWWRSDLYDVKTFQRLNDITERPIGGSRIGFSPDSTRIYFDSRAGIRIWSTNKIPIWQDIHAHDKYLGKMSYASKAPRLVTLGAREKVRLWDTESMTQLSETGGSAPAWEVAINAEGSRMALMSETGLLEVIDTDTSASQLRLDTGVRAADINFANNDTVLAVSTFKPEVQFRNLISGELIRAVDLPRAELYEMQPTGDGRLLFIAQRYQLNVVDAKTMTVASLPSPPIQCRAIFPNHDGSRFAIGLFTGEVELWDTLSRTRIHSMVGHRESVSHVTMSSDGALIASSAGDAILLWDAATGSLLMNLRDLQISDTHPKFPSYLQFVSNNSKLIVGYSDGAMESYSLFALDATVTANTRKPADIAASAGVTPPPDPTINPAEMRRWIMRVGKAFTGDDQNKAPQDK